MTLRMTLPSRFNSPLLPRSVRLLATLPFVILPLLAVALPGCGERAKDARPHAGKRLHIFIWNDYLDPALIQEFEETTGARVEIDNFSKESELEAKLGAGGASYDVVFPSDRNLPPLLAQGKLQKLDRSKLPNFSHLDPQFLDLPSDPKNEHTAPYFWGTLAMAIRTDHVKEKPDGFGPLFDEQYRGRIVMLDDAENCVAAALLHLGKPLTSVDPQDLAAAKQLLVNQREWVQAYTSDLFKEKLISGDAWVALGWNGDLLQAAEEEPAIEVIVPKNGTMIWTDCLAIPVAARDPELAHVFINYFLDPQVAARNAEFVRYATPNASGQRLLPPETLADRRMYLDQEHAARCQWLKHRGEAVGQIEQLWREVRD